LYARPLMLCQIAEIRRHLRKSNASASLAAHLGGAPERDGGVLRRRMRHVGDGRDLGRPSDRDFVTVHAR
jgi:hypothetical protein